MALKKKLYERREYFENNWLAVTILWFQRLLILVVLIAAGYAVFYFLIPRILVGESLSWAFIALWLLVAYVILPRVHKILSSIYVPSYFIGRVKTRDGLLGDPVNLAATGYEHDIRHVMLTAGWVEADPITVSSIYKTIKCTLLRQAYPEAPVSSLILFGRSQDLSFQQDVSGNTSQRHHVRFWKTPTGWLLPGGFQVDWLAAGTFDRSIGVSLYTLQITHKIAEKTDEERDHIVDSASKTGLIKGVEIIKNFSTGYHHRNGGGDSIITDGDLPILHF